MSIQICLNCIDFLKLDFTVAQRSGVIFPPYRGNARNEASQKSIFPLLRVCVHCVTICLVIRDLARIYTMVHLS